MTRFAYANLTDTKAEIRKQSGNTADDAVVLTMIERVSDLIARQVRPFHTMLETRYFAGSGRTKLLLPRPGEFVTATAIDLDEDGDATYEVALTENTDWWGEPANRVHTPVKKLVVNPRSTKIGLWPRGQRAIRIAATFGYSDETESGGTTAEALDDSETAVDLTAGHGVKPGHTIKVDSEKMFVTAVATNTATVVRAQNGTTAATHLTSAAVTIQRYPDVVTGATIMQVGRFLREAGSGYSGAGGGDDFAFSFSALYPAIKDMLWSVDNVVVA